MQQLQTSHGNKNTHKFTLQRQLWYVGEGHGKRESCHRWSGQRGNGEAVSSDHRYTCVGHALQRLVASYCVFVQNFAVTTLLR